MPKERNQNTSEDPTEARARFHPETCGRTMQWQKCVEDKNGLVLTRITKGVIYFKSFIVK